MSKRLESIPVLRGKRVRATEEGTGLLTSLKRLHVDNIVGCRVE
jgi:hypothetical protein